MKHVMQLPLIVRIKQQLLLIQDVENDADNVVEEDVLIPPSSSSVVAAASAASVSQCPLSSQPRPLFVLNEHDTLFVDCWYQDDFEIVLNYLRKFSIHVTSLSIFRGEAYFFPNERRAYNDMERLFDVLLSMPNLHTLTLGRFIHDEDIRLLRNYLLPLDISSSLQFVDLMDEDDDDNEDEEEDCKQQQKQRQQQRYLPSTIRIYSPSVSYSLIQILSQTPNIQEVSIKCGVHVPTSFLPLLYSRTLQKLELDIGGFPCRSTHNIQYQLRMSSVIHEFLRGLSIILSSSSAMGPSSLPLKSLKLRIDHYRSCIGNNNSINVSTRSNASTTSIGDDVIALIRNNTTLEEFEITVATFVLNHIDNPNDIRHMEQFWYQLCIALETNTSLKILRLYFPWNNANTLIPLPSLLSSSLSTSLNNNINNLMMMTTSATDEEGLSLPSSSSSAIQVLAPIIHVRNMLLETLKHYNYTLEQFSTWEESEWWWWNTNSISGRAAADDDDDDGDENTTRRALEEASDEKKKGKPKDDVDVDDGCNDAVMMNEGHHNDDDDHDSPNNDDISHSIKSLHHNIMLEIEYYLHLNQWGRGKIYSNQKKKTQKQRGDANDGGCLVGPDEWIIKLLLGEEEHCGDDEESDAENDDAVVNVAKESRDDKAISTSTRRRSAQTTTTSNSSRNAARNNLDWYYYVLRQYPAICHLATTK